MKNKGFSKTKALRTLDCKTLGGGGGGEQGGGESREMTGIRGSDTINFPPEAIFQSS